MSLPHTNSFDNLVEQKDDTSTSRAVRRTYSFEELINNGREANGLPHNSFEVSNNDREYSLLLTHSDDVLRLEENPNEHDRMPSHEHGYERVENGIINTRIAESFRLRTDDYAKHSVKSTHHSNYPIYATTGYQKFLCKEWEQSQAYLDKPSLYLRRTTIINGFVESLKIHVPNEKVHEYNEKVREYITLSVQNPISLMDVITDILPISQPQS